MILRDVLRDKGGLVHTIEADASLDDAVQKLVGNNCGSLVVVAASDDDAPRRMVGIISERDILRATAARIGPLDSLTVGDRMTHDVVTATPCTSVDECMDLMTERRIRHMPVMEDGELVGLVSIGDVVKARHRQAAVENHYLKSYIQS